MMRRSLFLLAVLAMGTFAGCETETVTHVRVVDPLGDRDGPDVKKVSRESTLRERVEKDPKDVQGWFELGEYYENGMELVKAIDAYERGNALLERGRYTGGHYLLARCYMRLQEWERSIYNLNAIFALEPKDAKSACLNPHFREAHYLRGAIYYLNRQWKPAKHEFLRFIEIGGEETRVEEWLDQIQQQAD